MLTDILRLSDPELEQLLGALSQGTIRPGGSTSQVRKAGIPDHAELVQSWLPEAMDQFGSIPALAAAIRLLRADRGRQDRAGLAPGADHDRPGDRGLTRTATPGSWSARSSSPPAVPCSSSATPSSAATGSSSPWPGGWARTRR